MGLLSNNAMKAQFVNVTKCPHCQVIAFAQFSQNNDLLSSAMNVEPIMNKFAAMDMGGLHLIFQYFSRFVANTDLLVCLV